MYKDLAEYNQKRKEKFKGVNAKIGAFLCDNPMCQYSDQVVPIGAAVQVVAPFEETMTLTRHLHMSGDGKEELYFCSICHNAVEMTAPPLGEYAMVSWLKK